MNNLIERLQKISAKIFQQSLKTYHKKDVLSYKKAKPHNLIQKISLYPNKGVGFHVWRKNWPSNLYIKITSSDYRSNRLGKLKGMEYLGAKPLLQMPRKISGASKRGTWEYDIGDAQGIQLDNGVVYTPADFKVYMSTRRSWQPKNKIQEGQSTQEAQAAQGEAAPAPAQQGNK